MKKYLKGKVSIKSGDDKLITVIASDETLDRHGDVLPIDQWDLNKFLAAPRMLIDHNHEVQSIVGKWENVRIEGKQLLMDAKFHGITELSRAVEEMVRQEFLDTVSVGFIYHGPKENGGKDSFELIETSWVTVPANPSARVIAAMKSLEGKTATPEEIAKVKEAVGEDLTAEEIANAPTVEHTKEAMEAQGWKVCASITDVNTWQAEHGEGGISLTLCETSFVLTLIADSEKLLTLTQADEQKKVEARESVERMHKLLKGIAHNVNDSLRKLNRQ